MNKNTHLANLKVIIGFALLFIARLGNVNALADLRHLAISSIGLSSIKIAYCE